MRLAAYASALSNLAVQSEQLQVDWPLLDSLLSISKVLYHQSTRAAFVTTHHQRELASITSRAQLTRDMPFVGPYLFSRQFTPRMKAELAVRQQTRELAGQLHRAKPPSSRQQGFSRPLPRPPTDRARQGSGAAPSPQWSWGVLGTRGRSHKGKGWLLMGFP